MKPPWRMSGMQAYTNEDGLRDWRAEPRATSEISWRSVVWFLIGFLLGLFCAPALAADEVELRVYPQVILSYRYPTYLRADFRIARHEENRYWTLAWASTEGISGSTDGQMEGLDSPMHYQRLIEVSTGVYAIECCVYRVTRARFCALAAAEVH